MCALAIVSLGSRSQLRKHTDDQPRSSKRIEEGVKVPLSHVNTGNDRSKNPSKSLRE